MSYVQPTQRELISSVASFFEEEISGSTPRLRATLEYALSRSEAFTAKDLYGFLADILKQLFPDSADTTNFWRWCSFWGIFQKAAVAWEGTYTFHGTNASEIPDNTQLQRADGQTYVTQGTSVIVSGTATATIVSQTPGALGTCEAGQQLSLTGTVEGVLAQGEVASKTLSGSDIEARADGFRRLLQRVRTPPSGGGPGDYERWALEVAGVTRAWPFANLEKPNSVSLAFVRDNDGDDDALLPDSTERDQVIDYIDGAYTPITVDLIAIEMVAVTVDIVFSALSPNTTEVRDAIKAAVKDLFYEDGEPGGTITIDQLNAAISGAAGETSHTLTAPSAPLVFATNEIPIVGTVTVV